MSLFVDISDVDFEYLVQGEAFMTRRVLSDQVEKDDME